MAFEFDAATAKPEGQFDPSTATRAKPASAVRKLGDVGLGFVQGAAGASKALADASGASNRVSRALGAVSRGAGRLMSADAQDEIAARQARIQEAEQSGSAMDEAAAHLGGIAEAPARSVATGLGSIAPTMIAALLTRGKSLAPTLGIGAAQGAGAVKGSIYDAVEQRHIDAGMAPEQAKAKAAEAQSYTGENAANIAAGAVGGAIASRVGAEGAVLGRVGSRGAVRRVARAAGEEAVTEGAQGGQERYAANVAEQREGFDTPTWQGVAGQAVGEGAIGGIVGGGVGAGSELVRRPNTLPPGPPPVSDTAGGFDPTTAAPESVAEPQKGEPGSHLSQPKSRAMGINPDAGPVSAAAAVAVDNGAAEVVQRQQAEQQAAEQAKQDAKGGKKPEQAPQQPTAQPQPAPPQGPATGPLSAAVQNIPPQGAADAQAQAEQGAQQTASAAPDAGAARGTGQDSGQAGQGAVPDAVPEPAVGTEPALSDTYDQGIEKAKRAFADVQTPAGIPATAQPADAGHVQAAAEGAGQPQTVDESAHATAATSPTNDLPEPTEAQKKAGNYRLGRVNLGGLDISIENPQGSVRRGTDKAGKAWENKLQDHYGYIRGTVGRDKDHVDVFIKPGTPTDFAGQVFVVDQVDPDTGRFDEHKIVIGAANQLDARRIYARNYARGWKGMKAITPMAWDEFKAWVQDGAKTKPLASVQPSSTPLVDQALAKTPSRPIDPPAADRSAIQESLGVRPVEAKQQTSPLPNTRQETSTDRQTAQGSEPGASPLRTADKPQASTQRDQAGSEAQSHDSAGRNSRQSVAPTADGPASGKGQTPSADGTPKKRDRIAETVKSLESMGATRMANLDARRKRLQEDLAIARQHPNINERDQAAHIAELTDEIDALNEAEPFAKQADDKDLHDGINRGLLKQARQELDAAVKNGDVTPEQALAAVTAAGKSGNAIAASEIVLGAADGDAGKQPALPQPSKEPRSGLKRMQEARAKKKAEKKPAKPKGGRNLRSAAYDRNPLMTFLATHGLYHVKGDPKSLMTQFSPDKQHLAMGYGPVFKSTGEKDLERLATKAIQEGYLPAGAGEKEMTSLIERAMRGERVAPMYTADAAEQDMQARIDRQREMDEEQAVADVAALDDNSIAGLDDDIPLFEAGNTSTEAAMRALGFTDQEIQDAVAIGPQRAQEGSQGSGVADEVAAGQAQGNRPGGDAQARDGAQDEGLTPEQANSQAGDVIEAYRAEFSKTPSGMTVEQLRSFASRRRDAQEAAGRRLLELADNPGGLLLPWRSNSSLLALHKDPRAEGAWRTTTFTPQMEPAGHMEFNAPLEAAQFFLQNAKAQDEGLTAPTREDVLAQQDRAAKAERAAAAKKKADEILAKKEEDRKATAQRSVGAADTFELGGDAEQNLSGQQDIFGASASPEKAKPSEEPASQAKPDALAMTPKQYHEAKLKSMAAETGTPLAEVREMYDTEGGRAENANEWVRRVVDAAQAGTMLTRATLDKLLELRPTTRLPETAIPEGYQRPEARKAEGEEKQARIDARQAIKAEAKGKIEDFGEALPPARRAMAAKLDESLSDADIANRPLSEIWPLAENDAIEDTFAAAVAHAARASVPAKPRTAYKLRRWVESVKTVRELAGMIVGGRLTKAELAKQIEGPRWALKDWWSKVQLLEQVPRDQWKRIGDVEERPQSFDYVDGKQILSPTMRLTIDGQSHWLQGDSGVDGQSRGSVAGNIQGVKALLATAEPEKRMEFDVRQRRKDGVVFVNKKGDAKQRPLMEFATTKEAFAAIKDRYDELAAAWEAVKARDNISERDLRSAENRPRVGQDHRGGKDVTPEQFQERFGFRGGEWGKWVQQGKGDKERQALLNNTYDALMDLANIVGIPPRAISLNGTLGIAFGSRGAGWASAHFEPSNLVINLTKTRGAGTLGHEWFHALDNYFSRLRRDGAEAPFTGDQNKYRDENYITHRPEELWVPKSVVGNRYLPPMPLAKLEAMHAARKHLTDAYDPARWQVDPKNPAHVRPEVEARFVELVKALNESPMNKRAQSIDKGQNGYWSRTIEVAARSFENYLQARMQESGYHNDFLANVVPVEGFGRNPALYPYLLPGEVKPIAEAFGALFDTIQTREDDAGNVAIYEPASQGYDVNAPRKKYTDDRQLQLYLDSEPDPSQQGPAVEAARRDAVAAVDDIHATGTILGQALSRDYAARQRVSLVGQKVTSNEDLAILAQVYRDPRFETLRVIFTDADNKVVSQVGLTSRLPAAAVGFAGDSFRDYLAGLSAAAKKRNATGFYMLHNHPSGISTASGADKRLTEGYAMLMPGLDFAGHVIIDTNEYTTIDRHGNSQTHKKDFGQPGVFGEGQWDGYKIGSPSDLMQMVKQLQVDNDAVTLIVTTHQLTVKAITTIPASAIKPDSRMRNAMLVAKAVMRERGSRVFAVGRTSGPLMRLGHVVVDAVHIQNDGTVKSLASLGVVPAEQSPFPELRRPRLSPDTSADFHYLRPFTQQQQSGGFKVAEDYAGNVTSSEARQQIERLRATGTHTQPAFTITPAMRERAPRQVVADIGRRSGNKLADYRHLALQTLGRRQLVDLYGDQLPQIRAYSELMQSMDADKNEAGATADGIADRWGKLKDEAQLADLMHDATLAQIDPAKPFAEGDKRNVYDALRRAFDALSPQAKEVYIEARDHYRDHHAKVRQAIRDRIERSDLRGPRKAELLKHMDAEFFKAIHGVYFPLARFGDYVVVVRDPETGRAINVSRAETMTEAQNLQQSLRKAYPNDTVSNVLKSKEFNAGRDAVGRGFMDELYAALDKKDMNEAQRLELEDMLGQLYLSALPDLSWAKHGIHRKGTPGFSQDARRAFAQNMFHGARYLAKVRYADLLENQLSDAQKMLDTEGEKYGNDQPKLQDVLNEMQKRHDAAMNPNSNPLSTALTSIGFVFHLGLSPASAMVNMTQTALVAYPIMGAKWGFDKAASALLKASGQAAANRNDISGSLSADERSAFDEAVRSGVIDVTMAHDLAGISQGDDAKVTWKFRPVMKWASFLFHHAEKFNRQVTFVASYRLAREAGASKQDAYAQAVKATYDGHFDYSACVDDETEILTVSGWKKRTELRVGDVAIATDSSGKAIESKVLHVNVFEGDREVIEFSSSRRFSMVLTPNHDAVVQSYNSRDKKWQGVRKVRADSLKQSHYILRAPLSPLERVGGNLGEDFAALLGWIAAEGWYSKYRKTTAATDVRLGQSNTHNPEYVSEIRGILNRLGGEFKEYTYARGRDVLTTFVLRRALGRRIQEHLPDKVLTQELVRSMSTVEMRAFLMAFLKGDGSCYKNGSAWAVGQKNGLNLDLLQAMATMCGMRATVSPVNGSGIGMLYIVPDDTGCRSHVRALQQTRRKVSLVWCPTTEHGTWVARRNGAVFVTGNSNRPRFMQGNVARVVLLFRQYSTNMVYTLARNAYLAVKGASGREKAEARKALGGILAMHAAAAGVLGLPMVTTLLAAASMIGGSDDEPWDAEVALRNMLADAFGDQAADVMARGLSRLTPFDISGRVGLDRLIFPDVQEGLEGRQLAESAMAAALGPVAGIGVNLLKGLNDMADGNWQRGLEGMAPSVLRGPVKALRYASEGAIDRTGKPIVEDVNDFGIFGQAMGFSPSDVRLATEAKSAVHQADARLSKRRAQLMRHWSMAVIAGDEDGMEDAREDIRRFNEKNPGRRINPMQMAASVRTRRMQILQAKGGVYLSRSRRDAMQAGAFGMQ